MTMQQLRNLKLSAVQSAKGFAELAHLSFIFDQGNRNISTSVVSKDIEANNPYE